MFPCQDCQSWHYFETYYPNSALTFEYWNKGATDSDKQTAFRDYNAYILGHTNKAVCSDCVSLKDYNLLTDKFPSDDCQDIYNYLNSTDTTYGNPTNWLTYNALSAAEQRKCFYSYYKWTKQNNKTYSNRLDLPTELAASDCPITGQCWYEYVEWCMTLNNHDFYNPEMWFSYKNLTDAEKTHLYVHLYDFTSQNTTPSGCNACYAIDSSLMPANFPCKDDCSEYYKYLRHCYTAGQFRDDNNWNNYDNLTNEQKRALYDYWNKTYKDQSACNTECVPIPTDVVPVSESFKLIGWGEDDWETYQRNCGDISVYENLDGYVTELREEIANIQNNGNATFTPTSGKFPTFYTYTPYFYQLVYTQMNGGTAQEASNKLYKAYLANPNINISKLYAVDNQYQSAYQNGVNYGLPELSTVRPCTDKYPEPEVWTNYNNPTYAYYAGSKSTKCTAKGACETTWCEYVQWVQDHMGQTFGSVVNDYWISGWYSWDLMKKYSQICGQYASSGCANGALYTGTTCAVNDNATNDWYYCEGCGTHRDNCILFRGQYCTALGTFCEGMPDSFRIAWGQNDDGTYPKKVKQGTNTEQTIYQAWCDVAADTTMVENFNLLNESIVACTALVDDFKAVVKPDADRYWEDDWTKADGSELTCTDRDNDNVYTNTYVANFSTACYNCNNTTGNGELASKTIMFENSKSNMPWSWRIYFGMSTNDWYKLLVYPISVVSAATFHTMDTRAKTCKDYLVSMFGEDEGNFIEYRELTQADYDDFTDPAWWSKYYIIGSSATGTYTNPCGASVSASGAWAVGVINTPKVQLKDILQWMLFEYTGSDKYSKHGNFWAECIIQATALNSGGFTLTNVADVVTNNSCLCGIACGSGTTSSTTPSPATQLRAARGDILTMMKLFQTAKGVNYDECTFAYSHKSLTATVNKTTQSTDTANITFGTP
jgi:hypothetical protein